MNVFSWRKKKKVQAQRQKLKERMQLKMVLPGDTKDIMDEKEIFALSRIRSKKVLLLSLIMLFIWKMSLSMWGVGTMELAFLQTHGTSKWSVKNEQLTFLNSLSLVTDRHMTICAVSRAVPEPVFIQYFYNKVFIQKTLKPIVSLTVHPFY